MIFLGAVSLLILLAMLVVVVMFTLFGWEDDDEGMFGRIILVCVISIPIIYNSLSLFKEIFR